MLYPFPGRVPANLLYRNINLRFQLFRNRAAGIAHIFFKTVVAPGLETSFCQQLPVNFIIGRPYFTVLTNIRKRDETSAADGFYADIPVRSGRFANADTYIAFQVFFGRDFGIIVV